MMLASYNLLGRENSVPLSVCGLLLILVLPPIYATNKTNCTIPGVFHDRDDHGHYVRPNLMCTNDGLTIQLIHNYSNFDLTNSRIQLFYECHDPSGNVNSSTVPGGVNTQLDDYVFSVVLSPSFTDVSAVCVVWGCYERSSIDSIRDIYRIQNVTCEHKAPVTEPTTGPTTVPDTTNPPPIVSNPHSSISPSPTGTVPAPTGTIPTRSIPSPTTTPFPTDPTNSSAAYIPAVVAVVVILALAVVCVLVLSGIILRFQQVQRRKNYLMRYYNYSEPIDPYFSPIDINAKVKVAVSLVSVFDTFFPNPIPPESTDDDRSEVLQGMNPNTDSSSDQSIKFVDQTTANNNKVEPPPEATKEKQGEPSVDDSNEEPVEKQYPLESGYESCNYLPVKGNPGYVIGNFQPSTIPVQGVQQQEQKHGDYVPHADMACTAPRTLHWNQNSEPKPNQFRTQLSSSASSGYVTDVTTPASDYYKTLMTPDPGMSTITMKHLSSHRLLTGNPVFDSTQTIDEVLSEEDDADSVVYSLDEGVEFDAIGGVSEERYVESVFAECSLSLNPSHFEPINYDELAEPTSPSYVNTTPGAELYHYN